MRSLTRFGVAAAATALASATALAGAGVASAQFGGETGSVAAGDFTMRSSSTLVSERTTDGVDVTYTNKTDRSLVCLGISAPSDVVRAFDAHVKRYGAESMTNDASAALQDKLDDLSSDPDIAGQLFVLYFDGSVYGAGEIELEPEGNALDALVEPDGSVTWEVPAPAGYSAEALVVCGEPNEDYDGDESMPFSYAEYVSTTQTGGFLGSLDVFGSLGSIGS